MNLLKKQIGHYQAGIWIGLLALVLTFLAWMMQLYSLLGIIGLGSNRKYFNIS